jgi:hypothetical protein
MARLSGLYVDVVFLNIVLLLLCGETKSTQTNDIGTAKRLGEEWSDDAVLAEQTGLSREQLYRSSSGKGNPTLKTTLAVMGALGIELTAKSAA